MDVQVIVEHCSADEILDQLIEECGELIQACTKLKRAYRGTTPVSVQQARADFVEEMADVSVAQAVAMCAIMDPNEQEHMFATESEKALRWQQRVSKV